MHTSFPQSVTTPAPLIPVFVAATAIGTAATIAGLGIQIAQTVEQQKAAAENSAFLALQTKLAKHQLAQYENENKEKQDFSSTISHSKNI